MKKIFLVVLVVVLLGGCGKKERGIFTVQNNSSYEVTFGIGEDYKSEKHTIQSGGSKDISWKQYVLFYPISPKNIINSTQNNNKAIITNATPRYDYIIKNQVCDNLYIIDGMQQNGQISKTDRKFLLSDNVFNIEKIEIPKGEKVIKCFKKLDTSDIVLSGKELIISPADSISGKEEKITECKTENGCSFFYSIRTNSTGKKEFIRKEISIEIKETSITKYIYISLF